MSDPVLRHPMFTLCAVGYIEDAYKLAHALLCLTLRLDSIGTEEDAQEVCNMLRLVGVAGARPVILPGSNYWSVRLRSGWCLSPGLYGGQGWLLRSPSEDRPRVQPLTLRVKQLLDLEFAALMAPAGNADDKANNTNKGTP